MKNKVIALILCAFLAWAGSSAFASVPYLLTLPTPEDLQQLAEIHTNILFTFIPESLKGMAQQLGRINHRDSVNALEDLLKKCDEIEKQNPRNEAVEAVNIARAYAIHALARLSKRFPKSRQVINDYFRISRPAGIAIVKARYPDTERLISKEINRLYSEYPSLTRDRVTVNDIKSRYSGIAFIMDSRFQDEPEAVDEKLLSTMLDTAVVIEMSRSSKAEPLCRQMLSHEGSFFWEKLVFRAVANLAIHPSRRYEFLRAQLHTSRNREHDECTWNLDNPDSILFSIKNISSEAFLLLSMWRMPYSLQQKVNDTTKSLNSKSFTARVAAIDCLATTPGSTRSLKSVLYADDPATRRFMAIRLSTETNTIARVLLKKLTEDKDPAVSAEAFNSLK